MSDTLDRLDDALADRYRIREKIGEGGMAEVYLAEDLKHNRNVALKVLRAELAAIVGSERFLQEIEVTAQLQHPNIQALYDSGEADGFLYYVMPLMEGETLREKLDREGQLPVDETVEIAGGVAAALDYAHRHDVIHRDIKPSNVLLHDGQPLVADFGIALAMRQAGGDRLTETGLSMGTPHYMSPEQAAGDRELDARSDVYSLGAVTYEMLVGEPPHVGQSAQSVVAKILSDTPTPIRQSRELVPENVDAAVRQALARSPADRFSTASAFADALTNPGFTLPTTAGVGERTPATDGRWSRIGPVASVVALLAVVAGLWGWLRPRPEPPVSRYGLAFAQGQAPVDIAAPNLDVAPDGSFIVYVGPGEDENRLWVKPRDSYQARPLPGTEGAVSPEVSPDGEWVSFFVEQGLQIRKVPIQGGSPITLADSVAGRHRAWMDDGTIVNAVASGHLLRVPSNGGPADTLWSSPEGETTFFPAPVPGSEGVLFSHCVESCPEEFGIWALDLETGQARSLVSNAFRAFYVSPGRLVYVRRDGGVFTAPFDPDDLELTGAPVPVLEGVQMSSLSVPEFALSVGGTLVMRRGPTEVPDANTELVWMNREGGVEPVDSAWRISMARNFGWDLSPDGGRLAIGLNHDEGDDIWIKELPDGPLSRLTYHETEDARPRWGPEGRYVYFLGRRGENNQSAVYRRRADGTGEAERVVEAEEGGIWAVSFSPDGDWLLVRRGGSETAGRDILGYDLAGDTSRVPLLTLDYAEVSPRVSPDGGWLAYASDESGRWEVYVRPFPDVESGRWQVSTGGGRAPLWAHSGRELFYLSPDDRMMSARVRTRGEFDVEGREALFQLPRGYASSEWSTPWDVSPDDQRFILARAVGAEEDSTEPYVVVENWDRELRERVGG